jgi:hypothetical protein
MGGSALDITNGTDIRHDLIGVTFHRPGRGHRIG